MSDSTAIAICVYLIMVVPAVLFMAVWGGMDGEGRMNDDKDALIYLADVRIDELNAENEKLRRERDFYFQQVTDNGERAHRAIDALNAENAELRKLLVDFRDAMWGGGEWTEPFDERMRELGIEVE